MLARATGNVHGHTGPGSVGADTPRGVAYVEYVDDQDVRWRVVERDARLDLGARGDRCLVFACAEQWRRVWAYPPDWRSLSVDALIALSWTR